MMTLDLLRAGESGMITAISGNDTLTVRLMEMGLLAGERVELLGRSPLGDPMQFRVRGYSLALRSSEARRVTVERTAAVESQPIAVISRATRTEEIPQAASAR